MKILLVKTGVILAYSIICLGAEENFQDQQHVVQGISSIDSMDGFAITRICSTDFKVEQQRDFDGLEEKSFEKFNLKLRECMLKWGEISASGSGDNSIAATHSSVHDAENEFQSNKRTYGFFSTATRC